MAKYLKYSYLLGVVLFFTLFSPMVALAQGNLLITPRRILFDGKARVAEINLANTGVDTARYTISFIQYRMTEEGAFEEITEPDPGQFFSDKFLRFFPRSVTLAPNEAQVVKVQVTNTSKMEEGEYRSHAYFRALPKVVALGEEEQNADSTQLSIRLTPVFGISIPVIIRVGNNTTTVAIDQLTLGESEEGVKVVKFSFVREGNMSVYGDIAITHIAPNGKESQISALNGVAVYTPGKLRKMAIEIDPQFNNLLNSGTLRVTYSGQSQTRPQKFAEAQITL